MSKTQPDFGAWLTKRLEILGLSRAAFGKKIGVSGQQVKNYELGSKPGSDKLAAMAKALDVSQQELSAWIAGDVPADASVRRDIEENAAIILTNDDTGEVWATVELTFKVRVHNPMKVGGRQGGTWLDVNAEGQIERDDPT